MAKVYVVDLTPDEREELVGLLRGGQARVRKTNPERASCFAGRQGAHRRGDRRGTAHKREHGRADAQALRGGRIGAGSQNESPRPGGKRKLTGKQEAYVVALACSDPPEGKTRWRSMRMLADKLVELEVVDEISDETVRRTLKRGTLSPR
jgi:hypothetical protein